MTLDDLKPTAKELLQRARVLLATHGFALGQMYSMRALSRACDGAPRENANEAYERLLKIMGGDSITRWSDHHSLDEILAAFDRAIEEVEVS